MVFKSCLKRRKSTKQKRKSRNRFERRNIVVINGNNNRKSYDYQFKKSRILQRPRQRYANNNQWTVYKNFANVRSLIRDPCRSKSNRYRHALNIGQFIII